jgi:hypothetical protein
MRTRGMVWSSPKIASIYITGPTDSWPNISAAEPSERSP